MEIRRTGDLLGPQAFPAEISDEVFPSAWSPLLLLIEGGGPWSVRQRVGRQVMSTDPLPQGSDEESRSDETEEFPDLTLRTNTEVPKAQRAA